MHRLLFICIILFPFIFFGCNSSPGDSLDTSYGDSVITLGNAHGIISGASFGEGTLSISDISKTVSIIVNNPNVDFNVPLQAYAVRRSTTINGFFIIFEIKNISSVNSYGFVKVEEVFYYDSNNILLSATADSGYSHGNVGVMYSNDTYTNTCLFPGQTGMILLDDDFYDKLDHIQLEVSYSDYTPTSIDSVITCDDYTYFSDVHNLTLGFHNNEFARLDVDMFPLYVIKNSDDIPIEWSYGSSSSFIPDDGNIEAGASGSINLLFIENEYSANKVEICFDFVDFPPDASGSYLSISRNIQQLSKYERLEESDRLNRELEIMGSN